MKKKILLIILSLPIMFSACHGLGRAKPRKEFHRSYIMYYHDIQKIKLKGGSSITISAEGRQPDLGNYKSIGDMKLSYDALCQKHGDMTFNRDFIVWDGYGPHLTTALGIDFISVDIVSDADFDAAHPAGTSLGDIVRYHANSYAPYIESGYTLDVPDSNYGRVKWIEGLLSEITPENKLYLLEYTSSLALLRFNTKPTKSKTHTFTVTMTPDDARPPFTASITMTFD